MLVAMSGGVDSSVAAFLLAQQGYEVIGAHMKLWDFVDVGGDIARDGRCCTLDSVTDCRFVCDSIGAPFYVLNLSRHFQQQVIDNFVTEYRAGRTPNPCVRCNSEVKWDEFLRQATALGCEAIATGHYAIIEQSSAGRWYLRKGVDQTRDQSYVLWGLSQAALAKTLMPLGRLRKSAVREIAQANRLRTAQKPESREICFVADNNYRRFLNEYEEKRGRRFEPGEIVHEDGTVLGNHAGTAFFTIGQRKGLGIAHPTPLFVQRVEPETSRVIVGEGDRLFQDHLIAEQMNWQAGSPDREFTAQVKIRYLHAPAEATVRPMDDGKAQILFHTPQRAITPGQSVVLYDGDILLGGGLIASDQVATGTGAQHARIQR